MSDFDKEAEREKLRKRFEAEEQEREITERMSELLLQGATMTNRHCDTCHSPIFTYQGQTFCPTCQVEVAESGGGTPTRSAESGAGEGTPSDSADRPVTDSQANPGIAATDGETDDDPRSPTRIEVDEPDDADNGTDTGVPSSTDVASADDVSAAEHTPGSIADPESGDATDTDLAAAQTSLSRTLADLSRSAERSDDLSRTRDYLLAVQEAADALAALKQARR